MGKKVVAPKATKPCGTGGMLPQKIFEFKVWEILFQRFPRDIFSKLIRRKMRLSCSWDLFGQRLAWPMIKSTYRILQYQGSYLGWVSKLLRDYFSRFLPNRPPRLPVTQSARSRRSYGKIGTVKCEQSVVACIRFG